MMKTVVEHGLCLPVKKDIGRKMIVTTVSCFIDSFWYAEMVLKMRSIMLSHDLRI
jgi:hypothetical protein